MDYLNSINMFFIVGKTRSGKDTIAKYLKENHGVEPIVSYTTRPKRDNETDGVEHYFVSKEKMDELKNTDMIAYTINHKTGIEYCGTSLDLKHGKWYSYIINPNGIKWFLANYKRNDIFFYIIYVDCPEEYLYKRGYERGEDLYVFEKRLKSEKAEFDRFKDEYLLHINTYIDTSKIEYEDMKDTTEKIYLNASLVLSHQQEVQIREGDEGFISRTPYYYPGDLTYLKKKDGKNVCELVRIMESKQFPSKHFESHVYICNEYPDTVFLESDFEDDLGVLDWLKMKFGLVKLIDKYKKHRVLCNRIIWSIILGILIFLSIRCIVNKGMAYFVWNVLFLGAMRIFVLWLEFGIVLGIIFVIVFGTIEIKNYIDHKRNKLD